ncbi:MAG TPA: hypothetical protein VKU00_33945 [Chthonomonadaceae bacterium]|nr:hypothetical protein [Chthonomonadaceae bacterium]
MNDFPCELMFVHRDAEREPREIRIAEIHRARAEVRELENFPVICVVPVRMQEAWLLFDEVAIRQAAGNPNGRMTLQLPRLRTVESLPDPKENLYALLREAKSLNRRRQRGEHISHDAQRVAEFIEDFSPLRVLPAFQALETEIVDIINSQGW